MKKIIALMLALTLSLLALTSCGTYNGIDKPNKPGDSDTPDTPVTPDTPDTPTDTTPFTVTLVYDDAPFVETDGMYAYWTREGEIHNAPFIYDEMTGISKASITGLDGDYAVTLLNLSNKYMYDANAYSATNNKRNTVIELFKFIKNGTRSGSDMYDNAHKISRAGAYTATITKKQPHMFYEFTPTSPGTYTITTICDINANEVNPSFDIYTGNVAAKYYSYTIESGAAEGSYTRNVKYEFTVLKGSVGQCFTFKVTASHRDGTYPMDVSFLVKHSAPDNSRDEHGVKTEKLTVTKNEDGVYVISSAVSIHAEILAGGVLLDKELNAPEKLEGEFILVKGEQTLLEMKFTRTSTDEDEAAGKDTVGTLFVEEKNIDIGVGGTYVYVISAKDGSITLYLAKTKFYADEDALAAVGEIINPTGKVQYPEVFVSAGIYRFDGSMFGLNEDDGFYHLYNEETGKYDGPILYAKVRKMSRFFGMYTPQGSPLPYEIAFVGGYASDDPGAYAGVVGIESPGNQMLHAMSEGTEDYSEFIASYAAYIHQETNPDGVYPVTEDLRIFLQKFAVSGRYFMDGNGWAETNAEAELGYRIYSSEKDQWLFACCYYV